jgi:hypothetical protein
MSSRAGAWPGALGVVLALAIGCDSDRRPSPRPAPPARGQPFVIGNRTPHAIAELRVAPVAERSWEPNLLGAPLLPGAEAVTAHLPCAHYDVLVVRSDGTHCVLPNTALCFAGEPWRIHDVTLEACLWRR